MRTLSEAQLLAKASYDVANKLDAMGVDGLKAIEGLVDFVHELRERLAYSDMRNETLGEKYALLGGPAVRFMRSIQRKDDERDT